MKITPISFRGIDTTQSPATTPEGTLSLSIGLLHEDGALRPIPQPAHVGITIPTHRGQVYLHQFGGYQHFIFAQPYQGEVAPGETIDDAPAEVLYIQPGTDAPEHIFSLQPGETPTAFASMGHTIVLSTQHSTYYILWRADEQRYHCLGTQLPKPIMQFSLRGAAVVRTFPDTPFGLEDSTSSPEHAPSPAQITSASCTITSGQAVPEEGYTMQFDTFACLNREENYYLSLASYTSATHTSPSWSQLTLSAIQGTGTARTTITPYAVPEDSQKVGIQHAEPLRDLQVHISRTDIMAIRVLHPGKTIQIAINLYKQPQKGTEDYPDNTILKHNKENLDVAFGIINQFRAEECEQKGRFMHPFFVRYGLRLFDGTLAHVSAPVLIVPNSGYAPFINYRQPLGTTPVASAIVADLFAQLQIAGDIAPWRDIIQQVEVFATEPVYPYNQGAAFEQKKRIFHHYVQDGTPFDPYNIKMPNAPSTQGAALSANPDITFYGLNIAYMQTASAKPCSDKVSEANSLSWADGSGNSHFWLLQAAPRTTAEMEADLTSKHTFYLVAKIPFDEMAEASTRTKPWQLRLIDGATLNLQAQPQLRHSEVSLSAQQGAQLFAFNGRIHAFGGHTALPCPDMPSEQRGLLNLAAEAQITDIIVRIHTQQGDRIARRSFTAPLAPPATSFSWFFYPHTGAYQLQIVTTEQQATDSQPQAIRRIYSIPLRRHDFLDGAFYYRGTPSIVATTIDATPLAAQVSNISSNGFERQPLTEAQYQALPADDRAMPKPSTIYVSEPGNPFSYLASSAVDAAGQHIRAISSSARPLSEGQFGQFPLYVFTDGGVWAAETRADGGYVVRQPITRDVLLPASQPLQLDGAVLFATERGIMQLSGRNASCITDVLTRHSSLLIHQLPDIDAVLTHFGRDAHAPQQQPFPLHAFADVAAQARLIYDYRHQRIILFAPSQPLAYVYSLRSGQWGQMLCHIHQPIMSYPSAMALTPGGQVVDFATDAEASPTTTLAITEPLKPDGSFALKNPRLARILGQFDGHCPPDGIFLWGTRNYHTWHPIASARGTIVNALHDDAYMAFRIGFIARLAPQDYILAATIHHQPDHGLEQDLPTE